MGQAGRIRLLLRRQSDRTWKLYSLISNAKTRRQKLVRPASESLRFRVFALNPLIPSHYYVQSLCFSAHVLCRHFSLFREVPCVPWLQNDPGANCLRCDKSQNSEPRNTRNFTDETTSHTVIFLTRKPYRPACCDFAFFLCSAGCFFVFSCLRVRYVPPADIWTHPENWVAGEACSKFSVPPCTWSWL